MNFGEIRINGQYKDLNPLFFGRSKAETGDIPSIHSRNFAMIHHIESGKGFFYINGKKYNIGTGDTFVFTKKDTVYYCSDPNDLWIMTYIGFDGNLCDNFSKLPPVLHESSLHMEDFGKVYEYKGNKAALLAAMLFRWHSEIIPDKVNSKNDIVKLTKEFINENYANNIRVESIAEQLKISRSYLVRVFKKETGLTVQKYLISKRLKNARKLIEEGRSIKEASFLSGFGCTAAFSRLYFNLYGKAPSEYRREILLKNSKKENNE